MSCSRLGRPRHVSLNACCFQKGEWESLWTQTLKHNNRELAHRAKKLDGNPPASASIRARARYAEYCARKGALRERCLLVLNSVTSTPQWSKTNQAMTSDLTPSAAPTNINEMCAKNPEPTHPARDNPGATGTAERAADSRSPPTGASGAAAGRFKSRV
jgi:hypothetical protein